MLVVIQFVAPTMGRMSRGGCSPCGMNLCNFGIALNFGRLCCFLKVWSRNFASLRLRKGLFIFNIVNRLL